MDNNKKVIEAEEFRIVDSEGKIRATFGMFHDSPLLQFVDKEGDLRMQAGLSSWPDEEAPEITIVDKEHHERIKVSMEGDNTCLVMNNKNGQTLVSMTISDEVGGVHVNDATGRPRFLVMAKEKKPLCVIVTDENGNAVKELKLSE